MGVEIIGLVGVGVVLEAGCHVGVHLLCCSGWSFRLWVFIVVWFGCFVLGVGYFIDRNFMLVIVVWSFRFGRLC